MNAHIVVLGGDGVGPEVAAQAERVLSAIATLFGHDFTFRHAPIGGAALDAAGEPLPPDTLEACRTADAVFLGAVGGPRWETLPGSLRPERGLLSLRRELGLYANIRPVRVHPRGAAVSPLRSERLAGVDFVVVRELTGGIYFGEKRRITDHDGTSATDTCSYSAAEVERIVRVAASLARQRGGRLVSIDKANVLETSRLWREVADAVVREEFSDVVLEHLLVDAAAMHLLLRPASFDVIVTENMFGDILTDEASVLAGSIGLLPSASIGDERSGTRPGLYEPIHGSAPDIAGRGIANPIGAILSGALLLRHSLRLEAEAEAIERAVDEVLDAGVVTADLAADGVAATTEEVADAVLDRLQRTSAARLESVLDAAAGKAAEHAHGVRVP